MARQQKVLVANGTFTSITVQQMVDSKGRARVGLMAGAISAPSGTITVADADFTTGKVVLTLGTFELQEGIHYTADPLSVNNTAVALAASIARLPGYTATALLAVVSITGPKNHDNAHIPFTVKHYGTKANLTLSPTTGVMLPGGPKMGPPGIA